MKNRFPFRLGTTSYIKHADILTNLHFLKDKVDHIELLVFETDEDSNYPTPDEVATFNALAAENDLTYTVHLPIGIKLGDLDTTQRRKNVDSILRAIDATRSLNPLAYDLHLERNKDKEPITADEWPAWQEACLKSLNELKAGGCDPTITGVENLEFDYAHIWPLVQETGFGTCFDMGHVWYLGFDIDHYLSTYLPNATSCHFHGYNEERDHKSLHHIAPEKIQQFFAALPNNAIPVSLEVFSETQFNPSMEVLNELA